MRRGNGPAAGGTADRADGDDRDALDSHDLTADLQALQAEDPRGRGRVDLEVREADLPDTAAELGQILAQQPMLFDRGGPARVAYDAQRGGLVADRLTRDGVINACHAVARPFRWQPQSDGPPKQQYLTLPDRVARLYLDRKGRWGLRPLDGIAHAPLLSDDGTMRAVDGYDPISHLWCEDIPKVDVPPNPSRAEAETAFRMLRDTFRTFAFADAVKVYDPALGVNVVDLAYPPGDDESAALALILTAVCRPSLGLCPGFVARAPSISGAGTGKGLLCRAACMLAYGRHPRAMTAGGTPDEIDKRIAAALIGAEPVLFIDNVNGVNLRSDILASCITERPRYVRPLGSSTMVPLNTAVLILVTGNGLTVSEDLARRFLVVEMDAGMEDPENRQFQGDLVGDIANHRDELLLAALTIWRWGLRNQSLLSRGKALGSFGQWCRWVRDPLLTLGCRDPVDRVAVTKANDPRRRANAELFTAWWQAHGGTRVTIADLAESVRMIADPQGTGRQYLAAHIRRLEGTRAAGFHLVRNAPDGKWSADTYQLFRGAEASGVKSIGGHRGHRGAAMDGTPMAPPMTPMTPDAFHPAPPAAPENNSGWEMEL